MLTSKVEKPVQRPLYIQKVVRYCVGKVATLVLRIVRPCATLHAYGSSSCRPGLNAAAPLWWLCMAVWHFWMMLVAGYVCVHAICRMISCFGLLTPPAGVWIAPGLLHVKLMTGGACTCFVGRLCLWPVVLHGLLVFEMLVCGMGRRASICDGACSCLAGRWQHAEVWHALWLSGVHVWGYTGWRNLLVFLAAEHQGRSVNTSRSV
jgi:hypothetical protein